MYMKFIINGLKLLDYWLSEGLVEFQDSCVGLS